MERDVVSPGIACEDMNECQATEEKVAGTDTPSASEDQGKNTGNVECGTPASKKEHAVSCVKLQPLHASDQLVTGRKSMTSQMSPLSIPVSLGCSDSLANQAAFQHLSDSSTTDVDCLICFNRYNWSRLPKVLSCQHVFCAVCLKLMLRNEDDIWRIACPVCRKVTTVFGGLICSLPNKVGIVQLADPGPNPEIPFSQDALSGTLVIRSTFSISQGEEGDRVAAKRLLFLLLLLVILIVFILPFVYGDLMKWVLCLAVALGLIGAGVLCCNPNWRCSCSNTSPPLLATSTSDIVSAA
ncbi:E3 ubiquitin-protein ligase RNF186 [Heteronotia binoei]|uniref:E3 ubiquitin-protein ligase RNF186 n=1 Tax=Heteronotia binoei TaxID=13085 RepID=UPI00292E2420|nr:E3 ubiquitin-protein ligase RNF186 [Heteronotia binoei]